MIFQYKREMEKFFIYFLSHSNSQTMLVWGFYTISDFDLTLKHFKVFKLSGDRRVLMRLQN